MTWDRRFYFPSEVRRAEDFFTLKIRRLRSGVNPRTWVPKASTLPLDHRRRELYFYSPTYLHGVDSDLYHVQHKIAARSDIWFSYRRLSVDTFCTNNYCSEKMRCLNVIKSNDEFIFALLNYIWRCQKYKYDIFARFWTNLNFHDRFQ
jgi:hypothetical protein